LTTRLVCSLLKTTFKNIPTSRQHAGRDLPTYHQVQELIYVSQKKNVFSININISTA